MDNLVLINKENGIGDYIPNDLVITDNNNNNFHDYSDPFLKPQISKRVYIEFLKLRRAALKDGYDIIIDSGYRSKEYQNDIWFYYLREYYNELDKNKDDLKLLKDAYNLTIRRVALPGYSEHQSGLSFDFAFFKNNTFCNNVVGSEEAIWMSENASKYGFILRYPLGKEDITGFNYEPWHYRYVGYPISEEFYNGNWITLEEYLRKKIK